MLKLKNKKENLLFVVPAGQWWEGSLFYFFSETSCFNIPC